MPAGHWCGCDRLTVATGLPATGSFRAAHAAFVCTGLHDAFARQHHRVCLVTKSVCSTCRQARDSNLPALCTQISQSLCAEHCLDCESVSLTKFACR